MRAHALNGAVCVNVEQLESFKKEGDAVGTDLTRLKKLQLVVHCC